MINAPTTELATIQEASSAEAGQEYTICTMDLGVCMKAYPLVWAEPAKYKNISSSLVHSIYVVHVVLEAKLISTGSVTGVTDGKNWDTAMNTHKSILEALERLLYETSLETHEPLLREKTTELLKITTTKSKLTELLSSHDVFQHISEYQPFREAVHHGELGETGQFWVE